MMRHQTNIADTVRAMSPDEYEVFDLILNGYNPSKPEDIEEFVARIDAPVADVLVDLLEKRLLQKVETKGHIFLRVNPAAAWFLADPEHRTYTKKNAG